MVEKKKSARFLTPVGRFSFIAVFNKARPMDGDSGEPKYELHVVFDKEYLKKNPDEMARYKALVAEADRVCVEKYKKPVKEAKEKFSNFRGPFRDGVEKEHLSGFGDGTIFIHPKSKRKPGVVGPDAKTPIDNEDAVYPGCYGRVSVHAFAYDHPKGGKGVGFGLDNVMFVRDGERLDGRTNPEDDFGEVGEPVAAGVDDTDDLM